MTRRVRGASATAIMLSTLARSAPAFLHGGSMLRALPTSTHFRAISRGAAPLSLAKGFGETPKPAKPPPSAKGKAPRQARSLMPLADAASKLLPKEGPDGTAKFDNPAVGDFQVLDALVEYPGSFELKIIGVDEDGFVGDIRKVVAECLTKGDEDVVKCTTRERGKYTSITLKVHVENSGQLYKCYEVINEDPRVKFKF